jgi:hypothetical protein
MLNEETVIIHKVQKHLKESYQDIADAMIGGAIDNMEKYKYMMGQAHAYLKISQEISNLLEPKEHIVMTKINFQKDLGVKKVIGLSLQDMPVQE